MMCCTAFATFFLLGVASGQTSLQISSCLTKEQNLQMSCKFTPATDPKLPTTCYYMTESKYIGSTNSSIPPESTFKNRANVSLSNTACELHLTGLPSDNPQNYTCFIKQTDSPVSITAIVDKRTLQTCSAFGVVQHSGAALLLAFLTFPLFSELL
ncbi:hypothetical protein R3I93_003046 [Phoxinus phoxinus]|uniref:Thy-1 membrane glycoprotein n=1 Tax=Phoxinus phoxinus TaxID=58324 RepID=A0AAN9DJ43_9TELE